MLEVELYVDRGRLVLWGFGDDRHLFALGSAFERVAQPEQARGDDAAHRAPPKPVDRSFGSVIAVNVVGSIAARIDLVHTTTVVTVGEDRAATRSATDRSAPRFYTRVDGVPC